MRKVIFDSDTASDDTIAMLYALDHFDVLGVTIVAGNVRYENQVKNALYTLENFAPDVPVYLGARRPLLGKWRTVEEVHGPTGLGKLTDIRPSKQPERESAVDAIVRLANEYPGELEILAVSPLTNIALAYFKDESLPRKVAHVWIMGGAFTRGNTTPLGEFNFWVDPEAAKIVLSAGFNVTIVPWEVTEETAYVSDELWSRIDSLGTKRAKFFVEANSTLREYSKSTGALGSIHPDTLTVMIAYDRSIATRTGEYYVDVETCGDSRGAMMVDWYKLTGRKVNAELVLNADRSKFVKELVDLLSRG
jgi:purine nucleosidase